MCEHMGLACEARGRVRETQTARACKAKTSGGACGCVSGSFWPFLVGFCSGLAVLLLYAFAFAIG